MPFELILRAASVLGRKDPVTFIMQLTRAYNPEMWKHARGAGRGQARRAGRARARVRQPLPRARRGARARRTRSSRRCWPLSTRRSSWRSTSSGRRARRRWRSRRERAALRVRRSRAARRCEGAALAQTTVYESRDKAGPVFSDKPSPAPRRSTCRRPTWSRCPAGAGGGTRVGRRGAALPVARVRLARRWRTMHSNTGAFEFSARAEPGTAGVRDRAADPARRGTRCPAVYRAHHEPAHVGEADWRGRGQRGDSVEHTLQVGIAATAAGLKLLIDVARAIRIYRPPRRTRRPGRDRCTALQAACPRLRPGGAAAARRRARLAPCAE